MTSYLRIGENGLILNLFRGRDYPAIPVDYDETGVVPIGWSRHPAIPADAVEVLDEVADTIAASGERWALVDGVPAIAPRPVDLAALKARLRAEIDAAAEAERMKYITGGAGQAMTYARKVEEARMAESDADPLPQDYPLLAASIGIDGDDITAIAALVVTMDMQWSAIGAAIEAARLATKKAIADAGDEAGARAAAAAVSWPN